MTLAPVRSVHVTDVKSQKTPHNSVGLMFSDVIVSYCTVLLGWVNAERLTAAIRKETFTT